MEEYSRFTEEDFINDEYFQDWVFGRCTREDEIFWQMFLKEHPEKRQIVDQAVFALRKVFEDDELKGNIPSDEKVEASFREISKVLGFGEKEQRQKVFRMKWMSWAAASIAVLIAGYWMLNSGHLFDRNTTDQKTTATVEKEELLPGGNKAVLTLADGTQIVLDSANNGQLANEGNVTVIKLDDGRLAYNENSDKTAESIRYNTIATPAGGNYQIVLSDGTVVWLNAKSSLRFPATFVGNERKVELTGEGYFEVQHDEARPFYVSAGGTDVKVLGTRFDVRAYADGDMVRTTLLQGKVQVKAEDKMVLLNPGQQARFHKNGADIDVMNDVDIEEIMAWKNGYFQFNNARLDEILKEAARWYDADIVYEGKVNDLFSGAMPRDDDVQNLLKILELTGKVVFTVEGKQIIVKPK